jgi:hypothetical protein
MLSDSLAVLLFPAWSVNLFDVTESDAVPEVFAVGVKVPVYEVPEPEWVPSVPPVTVTSPDTKSVEDSDSVKVIVSVWPVLSVPLPERAIVTVGNAVS